MTSAVLSGWICVGVGLLTAWFFPLANIFFSIAIILSIVAMATHQTRSGLLLLGGALTGIVVCVLLFVCGVAVLVASAFHAAAKPRPELASFPGPPPTIPIVSTARRPVAQMGTVSDYPPGSINLRPVALSEVLSLLTEGRQDDDVLSTIGGRPLLSRLGPAEITSLRAYGAGERLIDDLRIRSASSDLRSAPISAAQRAAATSSVVVSAPTLPVTRMPTQSTPVPPPVDYAARDRQIGDLQKRIDQIDETIRRIRADPHWYGIIQNSTDTSRQQSSDAYLDQLDKQRNDLRRQKWALEGR